MYEALEIFGVSNSDTKENDSKDNIEDNNIGTESIRFDSDEHDDDDLSDVPMITKIIDGKVTHIVDIFHGVSIHQYYHKLIGILETATSEDTIIIKIASPGGNVSIGTVIASAIINSSATVIGVSIGKVCSVAALIWSSCDKQAVMDGSLFLFHMSSHGDHDVSTRIREKSDRLITYVVDYLLEISLRKGHLLQEEMDTILDKSTDIVINSIGMKERLSSNQNYIPNIEEYL